MVKKVLKYNIYIMNRIKTFIPSKLKSNTLIPKNIIQTYHSNILNDKIIKNILKFLNFNLDFDYHLITDEIGIKLIKENFDENVLNAFLRLNIGAAKGDFLRYIALYIYGGVYLDLDSEIIGPISRYIDLNANFYFYFDRNQNILNTPLITIPKNPLYLKILEEMVKRINNNENNIFLATGPTLVTDVLLSSILDNSIYNSKKLFSKEKRQKIWLNNQNYKKGKIIYLFKLFKFKMDGYQDNLLYPDNNKYVISFEKPTLNLYKTDT